MNELMADTRAAGLKSAERFLRSPVMWLAFALFAASIAGCIVTIALALGQPDGALPDVGERLLSVPTMPAEGVR